MANADPRVRPRLRGCPGSSSPGAAGGGSSSSGSPTWTLRRRTIAPVGALSSGETVRCLEGFGRFSPRSRPSEIFSHRRRGASLWRGAGDMQHARNSTGALARAALAAGARPGVGAGPAGTDAMLAAVRGIGQVGVPENYGQVKDGPGTKFLGTPANHREVRARSSGFPTHHNASIVANGAANDG